MGNIGETLKERRKSKQLSLSQVEEETKIRAKYLQALEDEEFGIIPGRVYVKGFLRTYATFLGLDASNLLSEYDQLTSTNVIKTEEPIKPAKERKTTKRSDFKFTWNPNWNKYVAVLAAIVILALFNKFYPWVAPDNTAKRDTNLPQNTEIKDNTDNNGTDLPEEPAPPLEEEPAVPEGANLDLEVSGGDSWMSVAVDGETTFEGIVKSGESKSFQGEEKVSVRLGNAGVVQITFNGEPLGTIGEKGKVVTKEFTRNN